MNLFEPDVDFEKNYLPYGGIVNYLGVVIPQSKADYFFGQLLETISWENDEAILFGRRIITNRKVAWYGNQPFKYRYSNSTKVALAWTPLLIDLKYYAEQQSGEQFNSCLLNLYHNGSEGMAWHSDGEADLRKDGTIASVSLGAERKFLFKHKSTKEKVEIWLPHGSLLLMKGETQTHWLHRLPPTKKVFKPRINLTFRNIDQSS